MVTRGRGGAIATGATASGATITAAGSVHAIGCGANEDFDLFVALAQTFGVDVGDALQLMEDRLQIDEFEAKLG